MWWATMIDREPTQARFQASWACQEVVKISYMPLWPSPVKGSFMRLQHFFETVANAPVGAVKNDPPR